MIPNRKTRQKKRLLRNLKITSGTEMAMPKEVDVVIESRKEDEDGK